MSSTAKDQLTPTESQNGEGCILQKGGKIATFWRELPVGYENLDCSEKLQLHTTEFQYCMQIKMLRFPERHKQPIVLLSAMHLQPPVLKYSTALLDVDEGKLRAWTLYQGVSCVHGPRQKPYSCTMTSYRKESSSKEVQQWWWQVRVISSGIHWSFHRRNQCLEKLLCFRWH
ncbi:hypothetical protein Y1Q_0007988 [Alligator mississippiensis]|uniref:Uncharacterized protein n=1 Tax=Alligator mississippiensis TaxID=8496 RepID=A0A151NF39_ALLMI|nr:hypothetical protein Y1Q_0007988 [Alligator mississippiensis]